MEVAVKNARNTFREKNTFNKGIEVAGETQLEDVVTTGDVTNKGEVVNEAKVTNEGQVVNEDTVTFKDAVLSRVNSGAYLGDSAVTCTEYGDGKNHITEILLDGLTIGSPVAAANLAFGKAIYMFPAGAQLIEAVYMDIALTGTVNIAADTPDVGIGSVIGSGAVAVLGGTATFEDYLTGQTSGAISGANAIKAIGAGNSGIFANLPASSKYLHLNVADGWAGAGDVTASGKITIVWKTL